MNRVLFSQTAQIAFIMAFLLIFFSQAKVFALTATNSGEQVAKKYGVSFPISDLGNCTSVSECRNYCDNSLHKEECVKFAKNKGFYKENINAFKHAVLNVAKEALGCDSESSCKELCSQDQNRQKCSEFAKKYQLLGAQPQNLTSTDILQKAKQILGCDAHDSCKNICQLEENKQKCDEFAKLVGLRGGVEKKGPGDCTSDQRCKSYCSDPKNFNECTKYGSPTGQFRGPGGCNSESSCSEFCQKNPQMCKFIRSGGYTNSSDEREKYCKQYPERCNNATPSAKINPSPTVVPDLSKKCTEYGCSWNGASCNCEHKTPYPKPTSSTCQPPANGCGEKSAWNSSKCTCISYEQYCQSKPGCTWTGTSCSCTTTYTPKPESLPEMHTGSSVQGVSASRGLIPFLQNLASQIAKTF